jgi:high-affinity K+ transport system ATPase subunit B
VEKLLAMVQIKATVLRDGGPDKIPVEEIVSGDIVILNAGDIVPRDCLVQKSKDLFIDEATLTTWVRLLHPPIEGKLVSGFKGTDVGHRLRVQLIRTDVERGYIDFKSVG